MKRLSLVLLPGLATVIALTQTQTADISWRPKVGDVTKHRTTIYVGEVKAVHISRSEVLKVTTEQIEVEEQRGFELMEAEGSQYDVPIPPLKYVWVRRPDGSIVSHTGYDPFKPKATHLEGLDFYYPNRVVTKAETWIHKDGVMSASYTYVGDEEIAGQKTHRIAFSLSGGTGIATATATGTFWLRPKDGVVVKALARCHYETAFDKKAFDGTFMIELVD